MATIGTGGLATGVGAGTTTISATLNGFSGNTGLTVQAAPPAPTLSSIAVTPANPTILTGATQQFTATGTYSNNSTQNLTTQVTWASSSTAVATIGTGGLATGVSAGTTTISATLSGVPGSTGLTVQAAPLSITTASLPNGTVGAAYSATLAATGGTGPYNWSMASGSLPSGLTLNLATGVISGTPTAAATSNFTVQVTDSATPAVTTSKALSITVAATPTTVTIWPSTAVPGLVDGGADSSVELGVKFRSDVAGTITGIRFYKASANTGTHVGNLWSSTGTKLATVTFTGETGSGWQQMLFSSPVAITANTVYVASYHADAGHYSADVNYFATAGVDNPPLHALANGVSGGNGVFAYGTSSAFPTQTWNAANYWVDVVFSPGPAPTLQSIAVTPTNADDPDGGHAAVHGDGDVLGQFHTEPHHSGDLGLLEHGGGHHRHRRVGDGRERGDDDDLGHAKRRFRKRWSDGASRATCADAFLDCGDAGQSDDPDGSDAAVHGHGDLLGQLHAEPHQSGDVGLLEHGGGHHRHRRVGDGRERRDDDDLGDAEWCFREHGADGASRSALHHHGVVAQWHGGRSLRGDVGGHRWHRALQLVHCERLAAQRPGLEPCHWGDHAGRPRQRPRPTSRFR